MVSKWFFASTRLVSAHTRPRGLPRDCDNCLLYMHETDNGNKFCSILPDITSVTTRTKRGCTNIFFLACEKHFALVNVDATTHHTLRSAVVDDFLAFCQGIFELRLLRKHSLMRVIFETRQLECRLAVLTSFSVEEKAICHTNVIALVGRVDSQSSIGVVTKARGYPPPTAKSIGGS